MKRFLSALIAVIMMFTMIPFPANAAESDSSEYNELMALACEVFPEYTSAIHGENVNTYALPRSMEVDEIVYQETRQLSDSESMTLTQLASGNVIVLLSSPNYGLNLTMPSSNTTDITTVGVAGTATFRAACTEGNRVFVLSNVGFTIYYNGDCYFTNYGTVTQSNFYSYSKTNSSDNILCTLNYSSRPTQFYALELYFRNNQLVARFQV